MFAGDAATSSQQIVPSVPAVSDQLMVRRLKNRERQRRYRARKRLELDVKRSSIGQYASFQSGSPPLSTMVHLGFSEPSLPVTTQPYQALIRCEARVYCGRKWKREAREAHMLKGPANQGSTPLVLERPPLQAESNVECLTKRDWKADARSLVDMGPHAKE